MYNNMEYVLDVNILKEVLRQYDSKYPNKKLTLVNGFDRNTIQSINRVIENEGYNGRIVASSFAFIEILNKISEISAGQYTLDKIRAFINQPPEWFIIEPIDIETCCHYFSIPKFTSQNKGIELADAIHLATAYQRGDKAIFVSTDHKLIDVCTLKYLPEKTK